MLRPHIFLGEIHCYKKKNKILFISLVCLLIIDSHCTELHRLNSRTSLSLIAIISILTGARNASKHNIKILSDYCECKKKKIIVKVKFLFLDDPCLGTVFKVQKKFFFSITFDTTGSK